VPTIEDTLDEIQEALKEPAELTKDQLLELLQKAADALQQALKPTLLEQKTPEELLQKAADALQQALKPTPTPAELLEQKTPQPSDQDAKVVW